MLVTLECMGCLFARTPPLCGLLRALVVPPLRDSTRWHRTAPGMRQRDRVLPRGLFNAFGRGARILLRSRGFLHNRNQCYDAGGGVSPWVVLRRRRADPVPRRHLCGQQPAHK